MKKFIIISASIGFIIICLYTYIAQINPEQINSSINSSKVMTLEDNASAVNRDEKTTNIENTKITMKPLTETELINIAFKEAQKFANIPPDVVPTVQYKQDLAEIIWPVRRSPDPNLNKPGSDYHALIQIDRATGKIVKALASQD